MIKRRIFLQIASSATAWLLSPFKSKASIAPPVAEVEIQKRLNWCYLYNPGIDITIAGDKTFNQLRLIPGGKIFKVSDATEWVPASVFRGSVGFNETDGAIWGISKDSTPLIIKERIIRNHFGVTTDRLLGIYHPAREIFYNLQDDSKSGRSLIHIKEWDNKIVDLKSVNELIYAPTIRGRARLVNTLPRASWRMTSVLKNYLPNALKTYETFAACTIKTILERIGRFEVSHIDPFTRKLIVLTETNLEEFQKAFHGRSKPPSAFDDYADIVARETKSIQGENPGISPEELKRKLFERMVRKEFPNIKTED